MGGGASKEHCQVSHEDGIVKARSAARSIMASVRNFVRDSKLTLDSQDLEEARRIMNEQEKELSRLRHIQLVKEQQIEDLKQRLLIAGGASVSEEARPILKEKKNQRKVIKGEKDNTDIDINQVEKSEDIRDMIWQVCLDNVLFADLELPFKNALTDPFRPFEFNAGDNIISQGESGDYFYIVESGTLRVFVHREEDNKEMQKLLESNNYKSPSQLKMFELHPKFGRYMHLLGSRTAFGELALMYNTSRQATIHAITACKLWAIKRDECKAILRDIQTKNITTRIEFLGKVKIGDASKNNCQSELGKLLTDEELARLAMAMETEHALQGEIIIRQGQPGNHFYIIQSGQVSIHKNTIDSGRRLAVVVPENCVTTVDAGGFFGELALLNEDLRAASVKANTDVQLLTLSRADFISHLGPVSELLAQAHDMSKNGMGDRRSVIQAERRSRRSTQSNNPIQRPLRLDEMIVLGNLGQGSYGTVKLVQGTNGERFAAKCQPKYKILQESMQDYVIQECIIMTMCNSPFILKLHSAMQTDRYVYFILELLDGGELYGHLQRLVAFAEPMVGPYTSQVILAFTCLHQVNVVFRDLKPENIMLDHRGFVKVVDFGLSKILDSYKTWTMCGTPEYLAPEIIKNEGHNHMLDFWMLGILIYELSNGQSPFVASDEMTLYERIIKMRPKYPRSFSKQLKDLTSRLLTPQNKRLGNCKEGWAAVCHLWFSGFDWDGIENKSMPPPLKPVISRPHDYDEDSDLKLVDTEISSVPPCPGWWAKLPQIAAHP